MKEEEDCKNCKDSTGGRCLMHSMFILTPDYDAKPRYILTESYWMKIRNGFWRTNIREVKRIY